ncbi:Prkrir (predicted) [Pycnogonum litorale]
MTIGETDLYDLPSQLTTWLPDLEHPRSLGSELAAWKSSWMAAEDVPNSLIKSFQSCDKDIFPSVHTLLSIACALPVGSTTAERLFSTLRRIETYLRSTMSENRLSSLAVINIHSDEVTTEEVLKAYIQRHRRRMFENLF